MRIPQLTVAAAAALLLTACGSSPLEGLSGQEVADAAADALEEAGSVHLAGTIEQDGEEGEVDLQLQGEDVAGTFTVGGNPLELIKVGGEQFLKATADFWTSSGVPQDAADSLDDQWIILPSDASEFDDFSLAGIVDQLRNPTSDVQDEVGEDEVDGEDVVVVEQEDGSRLFVSDDEPSYPVQLTNEGDEPGTLTLSGFGEEEDISAPEDALDLTELMGG
jgi:hypothetical protein